MSGTISYTFPARFAGVELEIETWTEDIGRTVTQQAPSRGDGAQLSDRGRVPRTYNLSLRITGTADETAAKRLTLVALAKTGETRVFEHPLDGVIRCKLAEFSGSVAAGNVSYSATLVEDLAFTERFANAVPTSLVSAQDVSITGEELSASLNLLPAPPQSAIPDIEGAVDAVATWPSRAQSDVIADVEALRASSLDLRRELDADPALEIYQASLALAAFRGTYERYAQRVNQLAGATFDLTVGRPQPLIVLLSALYGAGDAQSLLEETARINDVLDPTRLPVGKVLTLPERSL